MNVGIYVRVSTEEQRDFGYSIEAQLREIRNYCKQRNLNIVKEYNDAGYSAKDLKRPEMERMIDDIKNKRINLVVAVKVDRLTREGYDGQWFLKFCKENDCGLLLLQENYDVTTPDGEMMYGMSLLFGQKERREIGNRTRRAMEEAVKQGKYPGKTPMGFIKNVDKKLEINPIEAEVIKDVFRLYADGNSACEVAKIMKANNRYLRDNGKWTSGRITKTINNPIYAGDVCWGLYERKKENQLTILNHSPAIIDRDLWERCQTQKEKSSHGNYGENIHIFHQVVRCPSCKNLMNSFYTVKHQNKNIKYNYYVRCNNKNCNLKGKVYNASKIEKELINILNDLSGIAILSKYSLNFPKQDKKDDLDNIQGMLMKLKNDENKLLDLYLANNLKNDVITKRLNSIEAERKQLLNKKDKMESNLVLNYNDDILNLYETQNKTDLKGINPLWNIISRETKRDIISDYIKFIDVSIGNNYNVKIDNITFNNNFIQNKFYNLPEYLMNKFKNAYKDMKFLGVFTLEQFNNLNLENEFELYDLNELIKYKRTDDKIDKLIKRYEEQNLEVAIIIENGIYKNAFILFKK